jgi:hypothetical protein
MHGFELLKRCLGYPARPSPVLSASGQSKRRALTAVFAFPFLTTQASAALSAQPARPRRSNMSAAASHTEELLVTHTHAHNIMRAEAERVINRVIAGRIEVFHALAALRIVRERAVRENDQDAVALIDAHRPNAP